MTPQRLRDHVVHALEDRKGRNIVALDVSDIASFTDYMVIASGTSSRHVQSLVDQVLTRSKAGGTAPLGVEGREMGAWVLLDLGEVVVHVMQDEAREFYDLERLWSDLRRAESTV